LYSLILFTSLHIFKFNLYIIYFTSKLYYLMMNTIYFKRCFHLTLFLSFQFILYNHLLAPKYFNQFLRHYYYYLYYLYYLCLYFDLIFESFNCLSVLMVIQNHLNVLMEIQNNLNFRFQDLLIFLNFILIIIHIYLFIFNFILKYFHFQFLSFKFLNLKIKFISFHSIYFLFRIFLYCLIPHYHYWVNLILFIIKIFYLFYNPYTLPIPLFFNLDFYFQSKIYSIMIMRNNTIQKNSKQKINRVKANKFNL
jgi:hypothetical protein